MASHWSCIHYSKRSEDMAKSNGGCGKRGLKFLLGFQRRHCYFSLVLLCSELLEKQAEGDGHTVCLTEKAGPSGHFSVQWMCPSEMHWKNSSWHRLNPVSCFMCAGSLSGEGVMFLPWNSDSVLGSPAQRCSVLWRCSDVPVAGVLLAVFTSAPSCFPQASCYCRPSGDHQFNSWKSNFYRAFVFDRLLCASKCSSRFQKVCFLGPLQARGGASPLWVGTSLNPPAMRCSDKP